MSKVNPTGTPQFRSAEIALRAAGIPDKALLRPGLAATTIVEEAILARQRLDELAREGQHVLTLVVVASSYQTTLARFLFDSAFANYLCGVMPFSVYVEPVGSALTGQTLK